MLKYKKTKKTKSELWGIVTYFNPERYKNKYENYKVFRENTKRQGLNLLVVECVFDKKKYEITDNDAEIVIRVRSNSVLWQKERLLNIALKNLPEECTKVAWLDSDIIFLNDNWILEACNLLDKYNILQLFKTIVRLKDSQKFTRLEDFEDGYQNGQKRFGYIYTREENKKNNYEAATGFAWAIRREIIEQVGFFDELILGGADLAMLLSVYGEVDEFKNIKSNFLKDNIKKWAEKFNRLVQGKIFYVNGVLLHLYHGDIRNRLYGKRYNLINEMDFDPSTDIWINKDGVWEWSQEGARFGRGVKKYFSIRKEGVKQISIFDTVGMYLKKNVKNNPLFIVIKSYIKRIPGACYAYVAFFEIKDLLIKKIIKVYDLLRTLISTDFIKMCSKIYYQNVLKNIYKKSEKQKDDVTIIIGVKDKPISYLENSLKSLRNQDYDQSLIKITLVDYGSKNQFSELYKKISSRYNAKYLHLRNSVVWNRSHCLNIGIKDAETKYLLSSDVDIVFEKNYISEAIKELKENPKQIILSKMLDAPQDLISEKTDVIKEYDKIKSLSTYRGALKKTSAYFYGQSINVSYTYLYKFIRGYDENYILWGKEDDDLLKRFKLLGIKINDISNKSSYVHQWHEQKYGTDHVQFKKNNEYFLSHNTIIRNSRDWGSIKIT